MDRILIIFNLAWRLKREYRVVTHSHLYSPFIGRNDESRVYGKKRKCNKARNDKAISNTSRRDKVDA